MLRRCAYLQVRGQQSGLSDCPQFLRLWMVRSPVWLAKGPLMPSKPTVAQKPSSVVPDRPVGLKEQRLPSGVAVCYLYQPGELEGGRRRATDPVWSLEVCRLGRSVTKPDKPVLYYLQDGLPRGFVRKELLVLSPDTQLPSDGVLKRWALLLLFFRCTRDRSARSYRGCGPRSCRSGRHWTAGCPLAGKPIGARCCTRHGDCSGPPSVLGCDQPSGSTWAPWLGPVAYRPPAFLWWSCGAAARGVCVHPQSPPPGGIPPAPAG